MAAASTDLFAKASNGTAPVPTTLSAQKLTGAASATITLATGWPTDTAIHFILYQVDANNNMVAGTETLWKGILSGTTISSLTLRSGTDTTYAAGSVVQMAPTSAWADDFVTGMIAEHNQLGIHQKVNGNTVPAGTDVVTLNTASQTLTNKTLTSPTISTPTITTRFDGWTTSLPTPNTVTYNGNRNYSVVFNSTDLTSYISNGMRLKLTRTATAPTQCTSLDGSTQYYSRASASLTGMTFTGSFTTMAWVKLASYPTNDAQIIGRTDNSTGGFTMTVKATGQLRAFYGAASAFTDFNTYQSLPLNKWVHIAASVNVAAKTAALLIDGVVAATSSGLTAATTVAQTGNLEMGRLLSGAFLPGKIAQAAVFSTNIATATIQSYISQGLAGTETSLISAYSFNNSINDLNANANNLTANGSAVATNADSPFGLQADGTTTGTTEYGIVTKAAFSTNTTLTVQVPEGNAIPTSGGVSAVSYSTQKAPYGFPPQRNRWFIDVIGKTQASQVTAAATTWYQIGSLQLNAPIGDWSLTYWVETQQNGTSGTGDVYSTLATTTAAETDTTFTASTTATSASIAGLLTKTNFVSLAATTSYYLNSKTQSALASNTLYNRGDATPTIIRAEPSTL